MIQTTVSQEVAAAILRNLKLRVLQEVLDELNTKRARVNYVDRILQSAERGAKSAQLIASCELFGAVVNGDYDWCFTPIPEMLANWCAELMAAAGIADEPPKPVDVVVPEEEANAVVPEEVAIVAVVPEEEANAVMPLTDQQVELAVRATRVVTAIDQIRKSAEVDEVKFANYNKIIYKDLGVTTRRLMNDTLRGKRLDDGNRMTPMTIRLLELKLGLYNNWLKQHESELAAKKDCLYPKSNYYK